jgi:3',5'-cyclic AMP phosphodiesterase CpdA
MSDRLASSPEVVVRRVVHVRHSRRTGRQRRIVRVGLATVVVLAIIGLVFGLQYRRQITSYLTHWKGSPTNTRPLVAFPASEQQLLHMAVAGDTGDSGSRLDRTATAIAEWNSTDPFDVLLLLGDNVYPNGDPAKLDATVFTPFAATLESGTRLLAILGNHDVKDGNGPAQMAALGMEGRWWAHEDDDVLLVGLDSNRPDDPEQLAWLEETLAQSDATWRIVALHHPPYSAGYQGSSADVRAVFQPVFERYGVQLVLSGHDHDYQRSTPINGVTYIVSGAGSGTRRTGEEDFTAVSFSWHHFLDVNVFSDRLVVRAVNQDLRVADEFSLTPEPSG